MATSSAKGLLLASPPAQAAALFHSNGSLHLPYLARFGMQSRWEGPEQVRGLLTLLQDNVYPGFHFDSITVHMDTPTQAFAEYHIRNRSGVSGRDVETKVVL